MNNAIPSSMQAVRLHGKGFENIRVDTIPVPEPNDNQALARVDAAGVCSSILKLVAQGSEHTFINGWDLGKYPVILGDEGSITIVKAGKNVAGKYQPGKRFAAQPAVAHPPVNYRERYTRHAEGMEKVAIGYTLPGHLAQYMLITEETIAADCLLPLPSDDIPYFAGALCEPLSCVISAQDRHLHITQQTPVSPRMPKLGLLPRGVCVIVGAGPMGQMHAEAALRFAPSHLIVLDVIPERLKQIKERLSAKARLRDTILHAKLHQDFGRIFDKGDPVLAGDGADGIHVSQVAVEVDCYHRFGFFGNPLFKRGRRQAPAALVNVAEYRPSAHVVNRRGRGGPGDVRHDDLVAGSDAKPEERQVDGGGTARGRQAVAFAGVALDGGGE